LMFIDSRLLATETWVTAGAAAKTVVGVTAEAAGAAAETVVGVTAEAAGAAAETVVGVTAVAAVEVRSPSSEADGLLLMLDGLLLPDLQQKVRLLPQWL
jgi:hypothetical protein